MDEENKLALENAIMYEMIKSDNDIYKFAEFMNLVHKEDPDNEMVGCILEACDRIIVKIEKEKDIYIDNIKKTMNNNLGDVNPNHASCLKGKRCCSCIIEDVDGGKK